MAKPLLTFNLNAFLKIYSMDAAKQIAEISRRMQSDGSGYDYYKNFAAAVKAFAEKKSSDEVNYILESASRPDEISYNKAAFNSFKRRYGSKKTLEFFDKVGKVKLAKGALEIRAAPLISFESSGVLSVVHFWCSQNPPMDKSKANIACHILEKCFAKSAPNYKYLLFDTVKERQYSGTDNTASQAVEVTAQLLVHFAKTH
ncbi:hypothetical protein K3179_12875 [Qipengyuania sp. GH38]|uniref:hypothetical protein n=1 Tax=Qipengyuania intermedia TaxID=2867244 RepID=UPI001C872B17|nr:hypothetical protein [Qipengyuania intermedia]MBX7515440.1 hypothetical protein [Qipengyuania intermedia]